MRVNFQEEPPASFGIALSALKKEVVLSYETLIYTTLRDCLSHKSATFSPTLFTIDHLWALISPR